MSKILLLLLGISIFVVLIMPTDEQKERQKKEADRKQFKQKFMSTLMNSVAKSEKCESMSDPVEKKECLAQLMDQVKEEMKKLRKTEDNLKIHPDDQILSKLEGMIEKAGRLSEDLRKSNEVNESKKEGEEIKEAEWEDDNQPSIHPEL